MITFVTSFSERYYNSVAQYSLPSWKFLQGKKIALIDDKFSPILEDIKIVSGDMVFEPNDSYFQTTGKKLKFWRKGMCFAWAAKHVDTDYMIWLDSDVKIFKEPNFEKI